MKTILVTTLIFISFNIYSQNLRLDRDTIFQDEKEQLVIDTLNLNGKKFWIKSTSDQKKPTNIKINVIIGEGKVYVDEKAIFELKEKSNVGPELIYIAKIE